MVIAREWRLDGDSEGFFLEGYLLQLLNRVFDRFSTLDLTRSLTVAHSSWKTEVFLCELLFKFEVDLRV